ncbi:MAG: FtsQ-type POTRA domain-containing protein [Anaeromyxobacteraceae bacterium]
MARGQNRRKIDRDPAVERAKLRRAVALAVPSAVAVVALALVGWAVWSVGWKGNLLRIREVRFAGLTRIAASELRELSPVSAGDHLLFADVGALAAALRRHPWIATVEVRRVLPPALEVTITERRAAALVNLDGLYLLDAHGRIFKRAAPGDGLDLPLVTGIARDEFTERQTELEPLLAGALALADRWSERGLAQRAVLSEIHVDPDWGVTLFAGDEGTEVRLGTGDIPAKLERLERVLAALAAEGKRPEAIHLDNRRRPDWVTVRLAGRRGSTGGRPAVAKADERGPRGL